MFPHHENEVVQSESYSGKPFATYWMHNGLLTKGGRKISKSDPDTIILMGDLLARHAPDTLRALLVSSHYRRPIDYGKKADGTDRLDEIARGLQAFHHLFERFERAFGASFHDLEAPTRRGGFDAGASPALAEVREHRGLFLDAMDDDFNTGGALGELFGMVRALNRLADEAATDPERRADWRAGMVALRELTQILGLFGQPIARAETGGESLAPALLDLMVKLRAQVRRDKNFALADQIRHDLAALGVTLEDRPGATVWQVEAGPPHDRG